MYKLLINGKEYTAEQDKKLLPFLRDDLRLTAAKDGCSEGACGTCTVLVDGKKTKACVVSLSKLVGKNILTVEGIPANEMKIYEHCFAEAGCAMRLLHPWYDYFCEKLVGYESEPNACGRKASNSRQPLPLHWL